MEAVIDIPEEWDYFIGSTYYKIYIHHDRNFVMMWNNKHYHRSQKTEPELIKESAKPEPVQKGGKANPNAVFLKDTIFDVIVENAPISRADIAKKSMVNLNSVSHALKYLSGSGDIVYNKVNDNYSLPAIYQTELFQGLRL